MGMSEDRTVVALQLKDGKTQLPSRQGKARQTSGSRRDRRNRKGPAMTEGRVWRSKHDVKGSQLLGIADSSDVWETTGVVESNVFVSCSFFVLG